MKESNLGNSQPRVTSLLGLPPELRNWIYECAYIEQSLAHHLGKVVVKTHLFKAHRERIIQPLLHQVNRQLRKECYLYYLQRNAFVFDLAVLDPDTGRPALISWAKHLGGRKLRLVKDIVVELKCKQSSIPLFSICFWDRTKLRGTRNTECKLNVCTATPSCRVEHQGAIIRPQDPDCSHKQFQRYEQVIAGLKDNLACLNWSLRNRNGCLDLGDIYSIAALEEKLRFLHFAPRWSRVPEQLTPQQHAAISRYESQKPIEVQPDHSKGHRYTCIPILCHLGDKIEKARTNFSRMMGQMRKLKRAVLRCLSRQAEQ